MTSGYGVQGLKFHLGGRVCHDDSKEVDKGSDVEDVEKGLREDGTVTKVAGLRNGQTPPHPSDSSRCVPELRLGRTFEW